MRLAVFLGKPGTAESDLVQKRSTLTRTAVSASNGNSIGNLYTRRSSVGVPRWVSFFGDAVDAEALGLKASSASGALVVPIEGRLFALAFGYGRSLINRAVVEESFGLRATLNSVPEGNIRSIDRKTFEGIATHVREQASKDGSFNDFGLNVDRDVLRGIVGKPSEPQYGQRMAGMDALAVAARVTLDGLPELLARYLVKAQDQSYKAKHPWIDNIAEVRDSVIVDRLNNAVVEHLRIGNLDRKWLAIPDIVDWADVEGFRYTTSERQPILDDIHLQSYLDQVRDQASLTIETLKRHRVRAFSATTEGEKDHWSVFKCMYAELELDGSSYLLNGGDWYRIDGDFVAEIDAAIGRLHATKAKLPTYKSGEAEQKFNARLAADIAGACLMDCKNILHGGGKSAIEFCDVLTREKQLIHVKKYQGSAVLSHLFAQGVVSARAFVSDAEFRKGLNAKLCKKTQTTRPAEATSRQAMGSRIRHRQSIRGHLEVAILQSRDASQRRHGAGVVGVQGHIDERPSAVTRWRSNSVLSLTD